MRPGMLEDLPTLRRLRERAWIAQSHLTTYPYTGYALFSLLTSWYPTDVQPFQEGGARRRTAPGLMRSLAEAGYVTAAYLPSAINEEDESLHRAVGISRIVYADHTEENGGNPAGGNVWQQKARRDRGALELLKSDLADWISKDRRFAAVFLPQIGHAPWPMSPKPEKVSISLPGGAPSSRYRTVGWANFSRSWRTLGVLIGL